MEKVISTIRLSAVVSAPVTTMAVSQIPGNTSTAGTTVANTGGVTPNTSTNGTTSTANTNTFSITASKTSDNAVAKNAIIVDYNIPASTGYKTCVMTVGTSADMITISSGAVITGNGITS